MITRFWHKIVHFFGWNRGYVDSFIDEDGKIMIGFRCAKCGKLSGTFEFKEN